MFIYFTDYLYFKPFFVLLQIHLPRPLSPYGDGATAHGHIQVNVYEYKHLFRRSRLPATSTSPGGIIGVGSINLLKPHNIEQGTKWISNIEQGTAECQRLESLRSVIYIMAEYLTSKFDIPCSIFEIPLLRLPDLICKCT